MQRRDVLLQLAHTACRTCCLSAPYASVQRRCIRNERSPALRRVVYSVMAGAGCRAALRPRLLSPRDAASGIRDTRAAMPPRRECAESPAVRCAVSSRHVYAAYVYVRLMLRDVEERRDGRGARAFTVRVFIYGDAAPIYRHATEPSTFDTIDALECRLPRATSPRAASHFAYGQPLFDYFTP